MRDQKNIFIYRPDEIASSSWVFLNVFESLLALVRDDLSLNNLNECFVNEVIYLYFWPEIFSMNFSWWAAPNSWALVISLTKLRSMITLDPKLLSKCHVSAYWFSKLSDATIMVRQSSWNDEGEYSLPKKVSSYGWNYSITAEWQKRS